MLVVIFAFFVVAVLLKVRITSYNVCYTKLLRKRAETFAEAEKLMLNDYPITPMWFQVTKNLVDPTLTGYEDNAKDQHRSRFMCRDGIKPAE